MRLRARCGYLCEGNKVVRRRSPQRPTKDLRWLFQTSGLVNRSERKYCSVITLGHRKLAGSPNNGPVFPGLHIGL